MKKLANSICAAAVALAVGGTALAPSFAAPVRIVPSAPEAPSPQGLVTEAQANQEFRRGDSGIDRRQMRRDWQDRRSARDDRRWDRDDRRFQRRGDHYYFNGHRGYRDRRAGYRQYNGWWFPPAAFIAGAIIGGAMNQTPAASGSAHVQWCYDRWRSYRASDNSYQPFNGPRRQCVSPYG